MLQFLAACSQKDLHRRQASIAYMFKKSFLSLLVFVASLSACAPSKTVVVTSPPVKPAKEAPSTELTWSMDVPKDWEKETRPNPTALHDVRRVLSASKTFKTEAGEVEAVLQVVVGHISKQESDNFAQNIVEIETNRDNAKVLDGRVAKLGQVVGFELVEVRQIDKHMLKAILMKGGAKDGFAVLASCGSPVQAAEEVMPECSKILDTLVIK